MLTTRTSKVTKPPEPILKKYSLPPARPSTNFTLLKQLSSATFIHHLLFQLAQRSLDERARTFNVLNKFPRLLFHVRFKRTLLFSIDAFLFTFIPILFSFDGFFFPEHSRAGKTLEARDFLFSPLFPLIVRWRPEYLSNGILVSKGILSYGKRIYLHSLFLILLRIFLFLFFLRCKKVYLDWMSTIRRMAKWRYFYSIFLKIQTSLRTLRNFFLNLVHHGFED